MRSVFGLFIATIVMGLAYWAYQENIKTQAALAKTEQLQNNIAASRARLAALKAEWAYLNRPDRLIELVNLNFKDLHLSPLQADNFGEISQIAFSAPKLPEIDDATVVAVAEREGQEP